MRFCYHTSYVVFLCNFLLVFLPLEVRFGLIAHELSFCLSSSFVKLGGVDSCLSALLKPGRRRTGFIVDILVPPYIAYQVLGI